MQTPTTVFFFTVLKANIHLMSWRAPSVCGAGGNCSSASVFEVESLEIRRRQSATGAARQKKKGSRRKDGCNVCVCYCLVRRIILSLSGRGDSEGKEVEDEIRNNIKLTLCRKEM